MADRSSRRKLAAILNADVVGYSRLMAADEAATVETLKAYRDIITRLVARHGGRVVNAPGDALLAEFPSAVEAVQAAIEIQQSVEGHNIELEADRRMQCSDRCTPVHCYRISAPPSSRRAPSRRHGSVRSGLRAARGHHVPILSPTGRRSVEPGGDRRREIRHQGRCRRFQFPAFRPPVFSTLTTPCTAPSRGGTKAMTLITTRWSARRARPPRLRRDDRGPFDRRNQLITLRGNWVEARRKHAQCGCRI